MWEAAGRMRYSRRGEDLRGQTPCQRRAGAPLGCGSVQSGPHARGGRERTTPTQPTGTMGMLGSFERPGPKSWLGGGEVRVGTVLLVD